MSTPPWVFSGVFALLQAYAFLQYLKDRLTRQEFQTLFFLGVSLAAGIVFLTVIYLTYTGMSAHRASEVSSNTQFMYLYRLLSAQTKKQNI